MSSVETDAGMSTVLEKSAISVRHLTKRFGEIVALSDVSLEVMIGETLGLVGPNGAGKSTLINIICKVAQADSGEIAFFDSPPGTLEAEQKKRMGVIPQEISLYENLTANENLKLFGALYSLEGVTLKNRIDEALEMVGLTDRRNDRVKTYSGGMKRRINIAASILHSPSLILMDEPTVGIDPQSRNLIFEVIEKLQKQGTTIIYTSHYMEEVERLCRRIGILDHGRLIALGTKDELIALIGETEIVEVKTVVLDGAARGRIKSAFESMPLTFGDDGVIFRVGDGGSALCGIAEGFSKIGVGVNSIQIRKPSLEQVFLSLTGKELRD